MNKREEFEKYIGPSYDLHCRYVSQDIGKNGLSAIYDGNYSIPALCCALVASSKDVHHWRWFAKSIPRKQALEALGKFYSEMRAREIDPKRRAALLYWRLDKLRSLCAKRRYKTH